MAIACVMLPTAPEGAGVVPLVCSGLGTGVVPPVPVSGDSVGASVSVPTAILRTSISATNKFKAVTNRLTLLHVFTADAIAAPGYLSLLQALLFHFVLELRSSLFSLETSLLLFIIFWTYHLSYSSISST